MSKRAYKMRLGQVGLKWFRSKREIRTQCALPNAPNLTPKPKMRTTIPINPKL